MYRPELDGIPTVRVSCGDKSRQQESSVRTSIGWGTPVVAVRAFCGGNRVTVSATTSQDLGDGDGEGGTNGTVPAPIFQPYERDPVTLARPWALPGTPGLEHRIGGLEKEDVTGDVSYDPINHEKMVHLRADKIAGIARDIPLVELDDEGGDARVLLLGWGSTYGAIAAAVRRIRAVGKSVAQAHLVHLNPFPSNLGEVLGSYERVIVPEGNLGQLTKLVRADFLVDARLVSRVQGTPFRVAEIERVVLDALAELEGLAGLDDHAKEESR